MQKGLIPITEICNFQGGSQPPKEDWIKEPRDGYIRMLQIRDFTQEKDSNIGYVKDTHKLKKCTRDDILIGRYGASIGKILTGSSGAYNVALVKVTPDEKYLLRKYLYYILIADRFQHFVKNIGARAAQAGFNKEDLSKFTINLPSLSVQNEIVELLDQVTELKFLYEEQVNMVNSLLKSLIKSKIK